MSQIRSMLRALSFDGRTAPSAALSRLDRIMHATGDAGPRIHELQNSAIQYMLCLLCSQVAAGTAPADAPPVGR